MLFKVSVLKLRRIHVEIKMSASQIHTPIVSMIFKKSSSWETLRIEGNKILCCPRDESLRY